jgi:hypothetical protein
MIFIGKIRICEVRSNVIFLAVTSSTSLSIALLFAQFLPHFFYIKAQLSVEQKVEDGIWTQDPESFQFFFYRGTGCKTHLWNI